MVDTRLSQMTQEEVYADILAGSYLPHYQQLAASLNAGTAPTMATPAGTATATTTVSTPIAAPPPPPVTASGYDYTNLIPGEDVVVTYQPSTIGMAGLKGTSIMGGLQQWLPVLCLGGLAVGAMWFIKNEPDE